MKNYQTSGTITYKNNLKHRQTNLTIEKIATHIIIEDIKRNESFKAKELAFKAKLVQGYNSNNKKYGNKSNFYQPYNLNFKQKKVLVYLWKTR